MTAFPGNDPPLFKWRKLVKSKTNAEKVHVEKGDVDQRRKQVKMASESAVPQVLTPKKPPSTKNSLTASSQSWNQLRDNDEANDLIFEWLGSKLKLEIEEDDLSCSIERRNPTAQHTALNYSNFNDFYNHLTEEEDHHAVDNFLQDLMEQEVLDSGKMKEMASDVGQKWDPISTMEARHQKVLGSRARLEAKRQRRLDATEEAKKSEREEELRKKQDAHREEEMVQQEMVKLRRQIEERKGREQLLRQREKERLEGQRLASRPQSAPPQPTGQQQQQQQHTEEHYKEEKIQFMVHMHNLKCLQRHFSCWYSAVLHGRLQTGKAMALCDWRQQLRAWRAWWAVLWAERQQREVARTEEELRAENRQCQLAVESDRRRLLRRCLHEWQLWSQMERDKREILAQQEETKRKMAALISAASTGKFRTTESPTLRQTMAPPVTSNTPETPKKGDCHRSGTVAPDTSAAGHDGTPMGSVTQPTQPWQVSHCRAAELHKSRQRYEDGGFACAKHTVPAGSRFENRHAAQQQIIKQQRKLLKKQQEQIAQLKEEQNMRDLELEAQNTAALAQLLTPGVSRSNSRNVEKRAARVTGEAVSLCAPTQKAVTRQTCPDPIITAMEERAHQRAARRKKHMELRRKKEEEKLAEMKAAEEQRRMEKEEEKRKAAEKRREEKIQEEMREEEKKRQMKRQQELLRLACHQYDRTLLLRRGLVPWKRLIQLSKANTQLAESHHNLSLLRRCTLGWQQTAQESLSEREASADQLQQHFLLRRSLSCWKRLMDWRMIQEEQAEHFYRVCTLRRFLLALLDHVTQERLVKRDCLELATKHNNRRRLWRSFLAWRQLPYLQRKEREKEKRRERLGQKVSEILPDFCSHRL